MGISKLTFISFAIGAEMPVNKLSVRGLLPDTEYYMTYDGSTTAPACFETVTWVIINKPIYITKQQVWHSYIIIGHVLFHLTTAQHHIRCFHRKVTKAFMLWETEATTVAQARDKVDKLVFYIDLVGKSYKGPQRWWHHDSQFARHSIMKVINVSSRKILL